MLAEGLFLINCILLLSKQNKTFFPAIEFYFFFLKVPTSSQQYSFINPRKCHPITEILFIDTETVPEVKLFSQQANKEL